MPVAIIAAFSPTTPPPKITTLAGSTPGAPPNNKPLPFWFFSSECAPACIDILPATALIGANNGNLPLSSVTVSYAIQTDFDLINPSVSSLAAARCK